MIPDLLTEEMANAWCDQMQNADETTGPHWSREKVHEIMGQYKLSYDLDTFYAVLNSIYSNYCEALRKNKASEMSVYIDLAKAWIEDRDAVKNKASVYYSCVIKHK